MFEFNLENTRKCRGYSTKDISIYCGIGQEEYICFEHNPGEIPVSIAEKLHRLLNISIDSIYVNEPFEPTQRGNKFSQSSHTHACNI